MEKVTLTVSQKLRIIDRLDSGETAAIIMSDFSIGRFTVSDIRKAKDVVVYMYMPTAVTSQLQLSHHPVNRTPAYPDIITVPRHVRQTESVLNARDTK